MELQNIVQELIQTLQFGSLITMSHIPTVK